MTEESPADGNAIKEIRLTDQSPENIACGGSERCTACATLHDRGNIESFMKDFPGREWDMQRKAINKWLYNYDKDEKILNHGIDYVNDDNRSH